MHGCPLKHYLMHLPAFKVLQFQCETLKNPSFGLYLQVLNGHKGETTQEL